MTHHGGSGSRLTIYIANSPIIIDHHRSPTLREAIDLTITSHFQIASPGTIPLPLNGLTDQGDLYVNREEGEREGEKGF